MMPVQKTRRTSVFLVLLVSLNAMGCSPLCGYTLWLIISSCEEKRRGKKYTHTCTLPLTNWFFARLTWPLLLTPGSFLERGGEGAQRPLGHCDGSQGLSAHKVQSTRSCFIFWCRSAVHCSVCVCVSDTWNSEIFGMCHVSSRSVPFSLAAHSYSLSFSPGCRMDVLDSTDRQMHVRLSGRRRSSSNTRRVHVSPQIRVGVCALWVYLSD